MGPDKIELFAPLLFPLLEGSFRSSWVMGSFRSSWVILAALTRSQVAPPSYAEKKTIRRPPARRVLTVRTENAPKVRFSATLGQEPKVELALV